MVSMKRRILEVFKQQNIQNISTSELVGYIYPSFIESSNAVLQDEFSTVAQKKNVLQQKAMYHRKILYHLNNLVTDQILQVDSIKGKGEKVFRLLLSPGEEISVGSRYERITLRAQKIPSTPIEKYEESGMLYKFEPMSWTERYNAILVESGLYENADEFLSVVFDLLELVNDVVGLNDFETFLYRVGEIKASEFIEQLSRYLRDYKKQICLIFDITNVSQDALLQQFLFILAKGLPQNILIIFDVTSKELMFHRELFAEITTLFAKQNLKLNIKNDDVHPAPYIIGRAGPYTIDTDKWQKYLREHYTQTKGLVISQSSVVIDIQKFTKQFSTAKDFQRLLEDVCKSLFISVLEHQKQKQHIVKKEKKYLSQNISMYSHSTIRFLHYIQPKDSLFSEFITLLESLQPQITQFAKMQELLYESCGMPINFDIQLSQAYRKFSSNFSLHEIHDRYTIQQPMDIYSQKTKDFFVRYSQLQKLFKGGIEIRFIREGKIQSQDGVAEIAGILNTYACPLFCYKYNLEDESHESLQTFFEK